MLRRMTLRFVVLTLLVAYVAYRLTLAARIIIAKRRGDVDRERTLRAHAAALRWWAIGLAIAVSLLLTLLVGLNSR
jgi:hypothetical protein